MVIASKPNNDRHFLSFSRKLFLSVISLFLALAGLDEESVRQQMEVINKQ